MGPHLLSQHHRPQHIGTRIAPAVPHTGGQHISRTGLPFIPQIFFFLFISAEANSLLHTCPPPPHFIQFQSLSKAQIIWPRKGRGHAVLQPRWLKTLSRLPYPGELNDNCHYPTCGQHCITRPSQDDKTREESTRIEKEEIKPSLVTNGITAYVETIFKIYR